MLGNVQHENYLQLREMFVSLDKKQQSMENLILEIKQKLDGTGSPQTKSSSGHSMESPNQSSRLSVNNKYPIGRSDEDVPETSESKSMGKKGFEMKYNNIQIMNRFFLYRDSLFRLSAKICPRIG